MKLKDFIDPIAAAFNPQMPEGNNLAAMLDKVIPSVQPHSEDLRETKFYIGKQWVEVRDDEDFHQLIFHIFNEEPENEYICIEDALIQLGKWRYAGNKLMFGRNVTEWEEESEGKVYELAFLDDDFFVLKILANPKLIKSGEVPKYFFLVKEKLGRKYEWRELAELLWSKYQNTSGFYILVSLIVLLIVAIVLMLS